MLIAMKTVTVIGAFRYLRFSQLLYCWSNCQLSSRSVVISFALVRHSLLRRLHCPVLENKRENGERAGCDSDACHDE